ncbi:tissue factor pathway inhibitor-like [Tropilaelaps mercedesae]|uniref:Tissue factor pathway inhibitor-like n=1 Tax=Tropilaelaps mercedesae TaxID=418985 RepID=A0A1V9WYD9_9ACAR|nr:tissue factor pathway inhibitor-like [Tropilaelaps mercedesae]
MTLCVLIFLAISSVALCVLTQDTEKAKRERAQDGPESRPEYRASAIPYITFTVNCPIGIIVHARCAFDELRLSRTVDGQFGAVVEYSASVQSLPAPAKCLQPPNSGYFLANFPRWFFNYTSGECERFTYGGCNGNSNRFNTEAVRAYVHRPHDTTDPDWRKSPLGYSDEREHRFAFGIQTIQVNGLVQHRSARAYPDCRMRDRDAICRTRPHAEDAL